MDDLDLLLKTERSHTRKTILFLGSGSALLLVVSGLYLLHTTKVTPTVSPLPPFHPTLSSATVSGISTQSAKINLNTADKEAILSLPGIGEVRANQIIEHRPYTSFDTLASKAKLPASVVEKLKNYVSF